MGEVVDVNFRPHGPYDTLCDICDGDTFRIKFYSAPIRLVAICVTCDEEHEIYGQTPFDA